jgi:hypothetical protein
MLDALKIEVGAALPAHTGAPDAVDGPVRIARRRGDEEHVPCRPVLHDPIEAMTDSLRELDRRSNDRIDVRLLWRERDDRVVVAVTDDKTGARFKLVVRDDEQALDVFHHPYAYAAHRGLDTEPVTDWAAAA